MQTAKIYIWLIGVAAFAAPIFYGQAVMAQNSQQGSIVLEVQQLREEIAELRGMIERQQYEIRQLKREGQVSQRPAATPTAYDSQLQTTEIPANSAILSSSQTVSSQPVVGTDVPSVGTSLPAVSNQVVIGSPQVVDQAWQAAETYPPVVDRSLGGVQPQLTSPPVIDRSIGGRAPAVTQQQVGSFPQVLPQEITRAPIDTGGQIVAPVVASAVISDSPALTSPAARAAAQVQTTPLAERGVIQVPTSPDVFLNRSVDNSGNGTLVQNNVSAPAPVVAEDDFYNQGFELLKQFKYPEAVNVFKQQIQQYPQGGYADDAHYWIAESMYLNRDLPESKRYFRVIIDNFAQSPRLPDAMLKTAYIEQEQGNEIEARILLQEIIQYHPRSDAAISAKNRLE